MQVTWLARFLYQDTGSGLRSVSVSSRGQLPPDARPFWQHDNFLVGSSLRHGLYWSGSCCASAVSLTVLDVAGRAAACTAGPAAEPEARVASAGLTVAVSVVAAVLVAVIVVAVLVVVAIKRRRAAQLAEMRTLPQAR